MIKLLPNGAEYVPDYPDTETDLLRKRVVDLEARNGSLDVQITERNENNRTLRVENAALTKRVAELEALKESKGRELWSAADEHYTVRCQLEKRVAELEEKTYDLEMALGPYNAGAIQSDLADKLRDIACSQDNEHMDDVLRGAAARIEFLQSQLAWTPVSDGLPTEPGAYEFVEIVGTCIKKFQIDDAYPSATLNHRWYTHFRRVELPKEGGA